LGRRSEPVTQEITVDPSDVPDCDMDMFKLLVVIGQKRSDFRKRPVN
jgi:hypothetical protein